MVCGTLGRKKEVAEGGRARRPKHGPIAPGRHGSRGEHRPPGLCARPLSFAHPSAGRGPGVGGGGGRQASRMSRFTKLDHNRAYKASRGRLPGLSSQSFKTLPTPSGRCRPIINSYCSFYGLVRVLTLAFTRPHVSA